MKGGRHLDVMAAVRRRGLKAPPTRMASRCDAGARHHVAAQHLTVDVDVSPRTPCGTAMAGRRTACSVLPADIATGGPVSDIQREPAAVVAGGLWVARAVRHEWGDAVALGVSEDRDERGRVLADHFPLLKEGLATLPHSVLQPASL